LIGSSEEFVELARKYISQMVEMGERFVTLEKRQKEKDTMLTLSEEVRNCTKCPLHSTRRNTVFGEGNPLAELMFVGEAPGREEDLQGRPFVGAAGQLLTKMIEAINLKREDVYIANILKCRPPENRDPLREEVEACRGYLLRQIELVKPGVICGLGSHATKVLLETAIPISRLRGEVHQLGSAKFVPTYHPAALLRNPGWKRSAWEDLKLVRELCQGGN
jgi:uracil-DNA glycosylase family 4